MSSGCGDVLSLADLQTAKKHQLFEAEVITGKQGGVASGADIDYATNQVTTQTQKTLPAILRDLGFEPASFDFSTGGTLGANDRNKVVYDPVSKTWYSWGGALPHVIAAGTNPVGVADWTPQTDPNLRSDLQSLWSGGDFPATVQYKYRLPTAVAGTVFRTMQSKLDDFVFLEDFGGKDDAGSTDNSIAFQKAFASGARKIMLRGSGVYGMATRDIELPAKYEIIGNAKNPEIKYLGTDTSFTMFTLTGSGPASNQWKQGGMFRDVVISSDVKINWILCRHVQNLEFDRVFFYNSQTVMNNYHYVNFFRCERWGSPFLGRADLNTVEFISEAPKFLMCFSSASPIDVWDTADLFISECTMFAGDYAVRTRTTLVTPGGTDQFAGYPVNISNSVFDAINGSAFDMESLSYSSITGNIISAGRTNSSHGVYIKGARNLAFTGNIITYCGNFGMVLENSEQCSLSNNTYNGNKNGGLSLVNCKEISVIGGANGTSYIRGGYFVQPLGITDPADNCNSITINGVSFDSDMATKISLDTNESRKNRIIACLGVNDTQTTYQNRGSTAQRPTAPVSGQMYYDTTLGLPIWYNTVSSTWKRADGTNV